MDRRTTKSETPNMNSLQGHLLLAGPHQLDPNFVETVILVVEHADRGAFGVIVNCPRDRHDGIARQPAPSGVGRNYPDRALAVR